MKLLAASFVALAAVVSAESAVKKHKKHHHKKHRHVRKQDPPAEEAKAEAPKEEKKEEAAAAAPAKSTEAAVAKELSKLSDAAAKESSKPAEAVEATGKVDVNGPLPADFNQLFAQAAAQATDCKATEIHVTENNIVNAAFLQAKMKNNVIAEIVFKASANCVHEIKTQAADPDSPLANGVMMPFLVAKEGVESVSEAPTSTGVDIDTQMPYGELEPFGREDTAHELTEDSIKESDAMVDQMERAEVAEEKRSVFRALTRLRGAAITSFDGVARSQTGNIDEYNKVHKWRKTHPLHHLASDESDVSRWAFPDTAQ